MSEHVSLTAVRAALAALDTAHRAALADVSDEVQREEWVLRNQIKGEAGRWHELFYRHEKAPTLFVLWRLCLAHEALLPALTAYDDPPPAPTKPPPLTKMRTMGAGRLRWKG